VYVNHCFGVGGLLATRGGTYATSSVKPDPDAKAKIFDIRSPHPIMGWTPVADRVLDSDVNFIWSQARQFFSGDLRPAVFSKAILAKAEGIFDTLLSSCAKTSQSMDGCNLVVFVRSMMHEEAKKFRKVDRDSAQLLSWYVHNVLFGAEKTPGHRDHEMMALSALFLKRFLRFVSLDETFFSFESLRWKYKDVDFYSNDVGEDTIASLMEFRKWMTICIQFLPATMSQNGSNRDHDVHICCILTNAFKYRIEGGAMNFRSKKDFKAETKSAKLRIYMYYNEGGVEPVSRENRAATDNKMSQKPVARGKAAAMARSTRRGGALLYDEDFCAADQAEEADTGMELCGSSFHPAAPTRNWSLGLTTDDGMVMTDTGLSSCDYFWQGGNDADFCEIAMNSSLYQDQEQDQDAMDACESETLSGFGFPVRAFSFPVPHPDSW
jgi:hypothetical protein